VTPLAILGAGAWGTALAIKLGSRFSIRLWGRDAAAMQRVASERVNARYLPGLPLPPGVVASSDLDATLRGVDAVVIATPVAALAATVAAAAARGDADAPLIWLCKGFVLDVDAMPALPHAIVSRAWRGGAGLLSGPSFAQEVAANAPTALTLASADAAFAATWATRLRDDTLRIYPTDDVTGVEVGGAVKNVLAIATGICDGLALGDNARAALITRGLAEMARLASALGGRRETLMGLSGLGDLVLTCTGSLSRNRTVGLLLAKGQTLAAIQDSLGHVAEGVHAARAARRLAQAHAIEMPISEAVCRVLYDGMPPREAVQGLLAREPGRE
jgi:glycerol-3-phosphate dehydrogenase (NAD(P)+)